MRHSEKSYKSVLSSLLLCAIAAPALLLADPTGADPRLTGAPGDENCTSCHTGTGVNAGGGSVKIILPGDATYTPGVKQRIKVQVDDAAARRWGFELTARIGSDLAKGQAGSLTAPDANSQVICENGRRTPCASETVVQFATHTRTGIAASNGTFEIDWTPPATDVGRVVLYAAGNGANGNGSNSGDHIYLTNVELASAAAVPKPTISTDKGVVNAANLDSTFAPGTWITIKGTNLSSTKRLWTKDDIVDGKLPAALDGVGVTVNGKPAFVQFVSPEQINALTPNDDAVGPVDVRVTSNGQTSDPFTVTLQKFAPALFTFDGKYLATADGGNGLLDKSEKFFAATDPKPSFKPGDTLVLYGTGFGPTDPAVATGVVPTDPASLANPVKVTIGGAAADITAVVLAKGFAGVYQLQVVVPDGPADGDQPVVVEIGGVDTSKSADRALITIKR